MSPLSERLVAWQRSQGRSALPWSGSELALARARVEGALKATFNSTDGLVHLIEDPELKNTGFWSTTIREADQSSPLYPWAIGTGDRTRTVRQEFRVPVGTVVQQFNIQ